MKEFAVFSSRNSKTPGTCLLGDFDELHESLLFVLNNKLYDDEWFEVMNTLNYELIAHSVKDTSLTSVEEHLKNFWTAPKALTKTRDIVKEVNAGNTASVMTKRIDDSAFEYKYTKVGIKGTFSIKSKSAEDFMYVGDIKSITNKNKKQLIVIDIGYNGAPEEIETILVNEKYECRIGTDIDYLEMI